MTTKLSHDDRIESARKIANAPASSIAELEAAGAVLRHVLAETDAELEDMASRRKTIAASDTPVGGIDAALERHDETVRALKRRNEIAAAVASKLDERLAGDRETERVQRRNAAYDEALKLRDATVAGVKAFLDRAGQDAREMMRTYLESEAKTAAANADLPPGAARIPSIEDARLGSIPPPKTRVRRYGLFVEGKQAVAEQGDPLVTAAPGPDGKWEVSRYSGSTGGRNYFHCDLVEMVELTTETDATRAAENLGSALSIPAFYVTDRPGWALRGNGPASLHQIKATLDELESEPRRHSAPRISKRVMKLTDWLALDGNAVEETSLAAE